MREFLNRDSIDSSAAERRLTLGPLEVEVMEVMWSFGASNVRDVTARMQRSLAYTTVMTTLDRLYKKGLLERELSDRAFVYSAKLSREDWDRQRAGEMMSGFLTGPVESRHLLLAYLVDAVGTHDAMLLDELERKVQRKREELAKANQK
jgi:predicted transcriptional regulator